MPSPFDLIDYREYNEVKDALLDMPTSAFTVGELQDVLRITAEVTVSRFGAGWSDYDALCHIKARVEARNAKP